MPADRERERDPVHSVRYGRQHSPYERRKERERERENESPQKKKKREREMKVIWQYRIVLALVVIIGSQL